MYDPTPGIDRGDSTTQSRRYYSFFATQGHGMDEKRDKHNRSLTYIRIVSHLNTAP